MEIKIFNKIFTLSLKDKEEKRTIKLAQSGTKARQEQVELKIREALKTIQEQDMKYSEYRVQKLSGVSINTIKKYRKFIEEILSLQLK